MNRLSYLVLLDLSRNQLEGPFPDWVHNLRNLKLLNLGQNDFSDEIPLVIGGRLKTLSIYFQIRCDPAQAEIRQAYIKFMRKYYRYLQGKRDLFWVNVNSGENALETLDFNRRVNEYLNSQRPQLDFTEVFQKLLSQDMASIEKLDLARLLNPASRRSLGEINDRPTPGRLSL